MKEIRSIAKLTIQEGKLDEFKALINKILEAVKAKDKGTIYYDVYYSGHECRVWEHYEDSEALLDHAKNVNPWLAPILSIATASFDIYGDPSEEVREGLKDLDITYYDFVHGVK